MLIMWLNIENQVEEERARVTTIATAVAMEEQQVKLQQGETQMLTDDAQVRQES